MRKYFSLIVCFTIISILSGGLYAYASTTYGFEEKDLSKDEINQIWDNISIRSVDYSGTLDSIGLPIVSFDVSEDGSILLGMAENIIVVANENEVLNYFEFSVAGSFYVEWKEDNILLMLVRSSVVVEFSKNGQLINMIKADDSSSDNNSRWNQMSLKKQMIVGQDSYCIKNDMGLLNLFLSSYSQLIKTDANGNITMIYDINDEQKAKTIGSIIIVGFLFVFGAVLVVYKTYCDPKGGT